MPVGVEEEVHQGEVIVEVEQIEIQVVDTRQPDANELIGNIGQSFESDNLPVEDATGRSRHAADGDHERLAGPARLGLSGFEAGEPAVSAAHVAAALGERRTGESENREGSDGVTIHAATPRRLTNRG
jgi:hypothetical protein